MNKILLTIVLLVFTGLVFSEEKFETQKDLTSRNDILNKLKELEKISYHDFLKKMSEINELSTDYIKQRQEECSGVYSTIITNDRGEKVEQKKKLSSKEKKLCKFLLVNFQVQITKEAFKLRKIYLKKLQRSQLEQLGELERKKLAELESLAAKYK